MRGKRFSFRRTSDILNERLTRRLPRYLRTNMQLDVHAQDMEEQRTTNALKRRAQSTPHLERQEVVKRLNREKE